MRIAIKGLGILIALIGIAYLLRPEIIKHLMNFFKKGRRIYFSGLLRFALAVVFFLGARECAYFSVIFASGIIFLAGGLLIFVLGPEKVRRILDFYRDQPILIFRVIALIVLIFGAIIIYSA
jgi:fumarate reductase subunit C